MSQRTTNAARAHVRKQQEAGRSAGGASDSLVGGSRRRGSRRTGFAAKARYRFDLTLARGSGALIGWLAIATAVFVVLTGLVLHVAVEHDGPGDAPNSLVENAWQSLMRTLDPGTVTGDDGWWIRSASLAITIAGIFIFSTLIGLIASVIDRAIENLRKGRGVVPETGHTLILGWNEKLHTIIDELRIANANQRRSCVVVLAPHDRVDMEDEINARGHGPTYKGFVTNALRSLVGRPSATTRIVCRTGNPADPDDLELVGPGAARSIIILADPADPAPDAQTTKVVLGLMSFDRDLTGMHVLAEFVDADNALAVREAAGANVRTVVSSDVIARITAQICRQSGLGQVYQELLDFDGDEIYFHRDAALVGRSYGDLLGAYESSSPIGVRFADGRIELNPAMSTVLQGGDAVIAISEDDDTLVASQRTPDDAGADAGADAATAATWGATGPAPDHLLMIGWNDLAPRMLAHLARSVPSGSTLDIVLDPSLATLREGEIPPDGNLVTTVREADTSRIEPMREILGARDYERIVIVGYRTLDAAHADARTLLGLVHARRILDAEHRNHGTSIVAELLEPRSVELGQVANPDDFVVSERLTSLLLAQLSENGELTDVFAELLDGTGVEITMRPALEYGIGSVEWRTIVAAAGARGESAIGVMRPAAGEAAGEVVVNPAKSTIVGIEGDLHVIVVA